MQDLNDLFYFAQVVEHGGFAAAGRVLGLPKSKLSRRVALLEERLGVRLLQRSTRRFSVTETGQVYLRHCLAMVAEASAAQEAIDRTSAEPRGQVRVSCPFGLTEFIGPAVTGFLTDYPRVRLHIERTNRRVDVIEDGFDIALRVRDEPLEDSGLVIRRMSRFAQALVASPALLARAGRPSVPEDLLHFDSFDMSRIGGVHVWRLSAADGSERILSFAPRLVTDDMPTLHAAALAGLGIVQLPMAMVRDDLERGALQALLTDWTLPAGILHAAFPTRRGLVPAVRLFLDRLVASLARSGEC
jgi:DNA-binding transcriptional LysR family regulator